MSRIHTLTRLASLIATAPTLLLSAVSAQAQSTAAAPAVKPATAQSPVSQTAKVASFIKICCLNLVGYNRNGETLLTAQDGKPFTINETGQRIHIKVTQSDIANAANSAPIKGTSSDVSKAPHKEVTSDISAKFKLITGDVSSNQKSADFFLKFTTAHNNIDVVGVNAQKHTIFKNQRGETFTINPLNGDMVFVK